MTDPSIEAIRYWIQVAEFESVGRRSTEHGVAIHAFRAAHQRLLSQSQREAQLLTDLAKAQARIAELESELALVDQLICPAVPL